MLHKRRFHSDIVMLDALYISRDDDMLHLIGAFISSMNGIKDRLKGSNYGEQLMFCMRCMESLCALFYAMTKEGIWWLFSSNGNFPLIILHKSFGFNKTQQNLKTNFKFKIQAYLPSNIKKCIHS